MHRISPAFSIQLSSFTRIRSIASIIGISQAYSLITLIPLKISLHILARSSLNFIWRIYKNDFFQLVRQSICHYLVLFWKNRRENAEWHKNRHNDHARKSGYAQSVEQEYLDNNQQIIAAHSITYQCQDNLKRTRPKLLNVSGDQLEALHIDGHQVYHLSGGSVLPRLVIQHKSLEFPEII